MSNFSAISWREQVTFDDDGDDNVCRLFYLYCASSQKPQSEDRHVTSLAHIILILSQPIFALTP
jgi:hypothetical protein